MLLLAWSRTNRAASSTDCMYLKYFIICLIACWPCLACFSRWYIEGKCSECFAIDLLSSWLNLGRSQPVCPLNPFSASLISCWSRFTFFGCSQPVCPLMLDCCLIALTEPHVLFPFTECTGLRCFAADLVSCWRCLVYFLFIVCKWFATGSVSSPPSLTHFPPDSRAGHWLVVTARMLWRLQLLVRRPYDRSIH